MPLEPEFRKLHDLCDELSETRGLVVEILEERDAEIVRLASMGVSKDRIAEVAGVAKISIYKVLGTARRATA